MTAREQLLRRVKCMGYEVAYACNVSHDKVAEEFYRNRYAGVMIVAEYMLDVETEKELKIAYIEGYAEMYAYLRGETVTNV